MARLTREGDALVIRLVYDGPPRSGKTTSLGALAQGMSRSVFSPEEAQGRTLFFDWLEYVGGNFDGIPIHCQILSVPGQPELAERRRALLEEVDVVVFVTNSTASHLSESVAHLRNLQSWLASRPEPRPGVVVQANYRDQPDALPLADLRGELDFAEGALVETVATENQGIRVAFLLAVRLALDRAHELKKQGALAAGPGETDDPAALLALLKETEDTGESARIPQLPDGNAPSGQVWPPIDGRVLLHSANVTGAVPRQGPDGSWRCSSGPWHFHSALQHEFERLDEAREELVRWTQRHTAGFSRLSIRRCIALAPTGWDTWRLWQVVRAEETWRHRLETALREGLPESAVEEELLQLLRTAAERLLTARGTFRQEPPLPCRLEVLGESSGRPIYVGLLPPANWHPSADELAMTDAALVQREIQPLIEAAPGGQQESLEAALAAFLTGV